MSTALPLLQRVCLQQQINLACLSDGSISTEVVTMRAEANSLSHDLDQPLIIQFDSKLPTRDIGIWRAWRTYVAPRHETQVGRSTSSDYKSNLRSLTRWLRWKRQSENNPRTTRPGVVFLAANPDVLWSYFQEEAIGWQGSRPASYDTLRKRLTTISMLYSRLVSEGIVSRVPELPDRKALAAMAKRAAGQSSSSRRRPKPVKQAEFEALLGAVDRLPLTWPRIGRVSPRACWSLWLRMFWLYGASTQDFVGYKSSSDNGLVWSELYFSSECPHPDIELQWRHGWIWFDRCKTGVDVCLPLQSGVRADLEQFAGLDPVRVFPNGRSKKQFSACWQAIVAEAKVRPDVSISGTGVPSLRKGCGQTWSLRTRGADVAGNVLGHKSSSITTEHYVELIEVVCDLIESHPLAPQYRQRDLF